MGLEISGFRFSGIRVWVAGFSFSGTRIRFWGHLALGGLDFDRLDLDLLDQLHHVCGGLLELVQPVFEGGGGGSGSGSRDEGARMRVEG